MINQHLVVENGELLAGDSVRIEIARTKNAGCLGEFREFGGGFGHYLDFTNCRG